MLINGALGHFKNDLHIGAQKRAANLIPKAISAITAGCTKGSIDASTSLRNIHVKPLSDQSTDLKMIATASEVIVPKNLARPARTKTEALDIKNSQLNGNLNLKKLELALKSEITEKLQRANALGKPLLILVGEHHESLDSKLLELMILKISKDLSITNCLVESTQEDLSVGDRYIDWDLNLAEAVGMNMIAADPKQEDISIKVRQAAMNDSICATVGHSVMVVGASHLHPIVSDTLISDKFECLVLDTTNIDEKSRTKMLLDISLEAHPKPRAKQAILESFNPRFAQRVNIAENTTREEKISFLRELFNWLSEGARAFFNIDEMIAAIPE